MFQQYDLIPGDLRADVRICDQEYEAIQKGINRQPGYIVDWQMVNKAWELAVIRHCNTKTSRRKSGELYLYHPRAVMEELARLRCKSSVLAAALLHDTMEDCGLTYEELRRDFSYEVAQIVQAVTAIKSEEKTEDLHYATMSRDEKHAFLDRLTDAKLIASQFQREAFLVRFADRVHNLSTISACSTGKRLEKIASTRAFLIPAAKMLGMNYFVVTLSDLCMKYDGEDYQNNECVQLLKQRKALTRVGGMAYSRFDQLLEDALAEQQMFAFPKFNPFAKLRGFSREGGEGIVTTTRRVLMPYELQQQLQHTPYFERSRLDLWEIILTSKESNPKEMLARFLQLYRTHLKPEGIFFEYRGTENNALLLCLTDEMENNYRVVLVPESGLEAYFIGNPDGERLTMIDEEAPGDALRPQITVYSYSPKKGYRAYRKCVPYGATALDFAFIVSPALAITVKSVRLHKWKGEDTLPFVDSDYTYPLHTVLSDGDVVHFDADYFPVIPGEEGAYQESIPHATIDWFADVNTELAKNCLIRYFKGKYGTGKE